VEDGNVREAGGAADACEESRYCGFVRIAGGV
jgi:hypothetical protein